MLELKTNGIQAQTISVIVPCRNEREHIDVFCASVLEQRIPEGCSLEILIADGLSDDGTRERLSHWVQEDPRFVLIDNPGRIVSTGLNRCIERAKGSFIVRLDVHTVYAHDYIEQCWLTWQRTGADNVGGPWRAMGMPGQYVQQAIAAAFQSKWVAGGALSRDLAYEGEVDTVYLGAWPRQTFERFGGFDEKLVRNQDDEHNLRIRKGGGRIWQSALIRSTYHPRSSVADVFSQYRQYGYWKPFVMKKHGQAAAIRHLIPGLFVGALIGLLVLMMAFSGLTMMADTLTTTRWVGAWGSAACAVMLMALLLTYGTAVGLVSVAIARDLGWRQLRYLPDVIAAYHFGYGLGSLRGWWDAWLRGKPDPAYGRLTRGQRQNRT
ncbi:MAG TPA: glycosyltransferase family 2 protein [Aquabacterium sp.]|nr:glycosyltransferase family 2 protein [Aquabacterium sp.]